jgi:hypothetical protein
MIGRAWAKGSDRTFVPPGLNVTSYTAVVSRARLELTWLLAQITSETVTGAPLKLELQAS